MKVRFALFGLATLLAVAAIAAVRLAPTSDTAQGHVARDTGRAGVNTAGLAGMMGQSVGGLGLAL